MYRIGFFVSVFTLAGGWIRAQDNCDCINAQVISKGSSPVYGSSGTGKLLEISDPSNTSLYYFEKEHNTSWFRFEI